MSARRKASRAVDPNRHPLYSWRADRKAGLARIREAIRYALADKQEALERAANPEWMAGACKVSQDWARDHASRTIRYLARKHLEYWRMRAFMEGCYSGYPGDKVASDHWGRFQ